MTRGAGRKAPGSPKVKARSARVTTRVRATATAADRDVRERLTEQLGYRFADEALLELALTHSSFIYEARLGRAKSNSDEPNQPGTDNEQLEFLGDAVLGLAVTELLLHAFPERTEGELTRMRASLVSRQRLAEMGATLGLGPLLRMGKSAEAGEGRSKPAVLANTVEALLGAVYLDVSRTADARSRSGEKALRTVRNLLDELLVDPGLPLIRQALEASPGRGALRDAKSRLQERVQAGAAGRLLYTDIAEAGPAHARHFTVAVQLALPSGETHTLATGDGPNKKAAQQAAAELALVAWEAHAGNGNATTRGNEPGARAQDPSR